MGELNSKNDLTVEPRKTLETYDLTKKKRTPTLIKSITEMFAEELQVWTATKLHNYE